MSEPVTNVEIEDVLSSIRKLVSDGDKARTRDQMRTSAEPDIVDDPVEQGESKPDRLVLTPAFLVVGDEDDAAEDTHADSHQTKDADVALGDFEHEQHVEAPFSERDEDQTDPSEEAPAFEDMVWEDVDGDDAELEPDAAAAAPSLGDRSSLAATIAELEAAVSSNDDEYEPDGSEVMAEAVSWPESAMREIDDIEDAQIAVAATTVEALVQRPDEPVDFPPAEDADDEIDAAEVHEEPDAQHMHEEPDAQHMHEEPDAQHMHEEPDAQHMYEEPDAHGEVEEFEEEPIAFSHRETVDVSPHTSEDAEADVFQDDDLDDLLGAGGLKLDDAALRSLVSEVVKEELTGPLGERITRNVRKLVRREIYRILSSKEFD